MCWQCFDAEAIRGGFEFLDLQAKTRFLDQYLQRLYHACKETFPNTDFIELKNQNLHFNYRHFLNMGYLRHTIDYLP